MEEEQDKVNDSPIEQVRLTIPITDDPSLPTLTFRVWLMGLTSCILLSFGNQFFVYRQNLIYISPSVFQLLNLPIGHLMARTLPTKPIRVPGTTWTFSLNPGPFNIKEHVLLSMIASAGGEGAGYSMEIISQTKIFYHRKLSPLAAYLILITTQMLGYGFAGMVTKLFVESPHMWWPETLVSVSFYRALHDVERRQRGQLTKLQFFLIVSILSFAYYLVPNYFFPSITALSIVCWIWKNSITAQQIGAGRNGLGLGSFAFDWVTITYAGDPIGTPMFSIINKMVGFVLVLYIIIPVAYWNNIYNAKQFPIFSADLFDANGNQYNISRVLDGKEFKFNQQAYDNYSKIHVSIFYALQLGISFAIVTASLTYTALHYGKTFYRQIKEAYSNRSSNMDIHNRMMKKYKHIPQWWFYTVLFTTLGLSIYTSENFQDQLQIPFWWILIACVMVMIFIIPLSAIKATTNQAMDISIIGDLLVGYLHPGRPIANMAFKCYCSVTLLHAMSFLFDLKQGLYMKIPPRSMFVAQIVGPLVSTTVSYGTAWWIFSTVKHICEPDKLPAGSPWTCPGENVVFSASGIWGVAGPSNVFAPFGLYAKMYYFFLIGMLATVLVWMLTRAFPKNTWIKLIHVPIILGATLSMPPVTPVQYWSWFFVGFFFNFVIYRKYKDWWAKYAYLMSTAMTSGAAIMAFLASIGLPNIYGIKWWGLELDDHCPLAHCPTAPGIVVDGCPAFQ